MKCLVVKGKSKNSKVKRPVGENVTTESLEEITFVKKFRFHLISLAHLPQSPTYLSCAFTQKNLKLSRMLKSLGHEVIFYGSEGSEVECTKFVQTHSLSDIRKDYGDGDNRFETGYDWRNVDYRHDFNSKRKPSTLKFYNSCIEAINADKQDDDFLLLTQGSY